MRLTETVFGDIYLWCEGRLLTVNPHRHTPNQIPNPAHRSGSKSPVQPKTPPTVAPARTPPPPVPHPALTLGPFN